MTTKANTVELVLRARDEASLTFKEITALTNNLRVMQERLGDTLSGTSKNASQLEGELKKVGGAQKSIKDLAGGLDSLIEGKERLRSLGNEATALRTKLRELNQSAFDIQAAGGDPKLVKELEKIRFKATETRQQIKQFTRDIDELQARAASGNGTAQEARRLETLKRKVSELRQLLPTLEHAAERMRAKLKESFGPVPNDLSREIKKTAGDLARVDGQVDRVTASLNRYEQELTEAGVDTRDLGAAQQRLAGTSERLASATTRASAENQRYTSTSQGALAATARLRSHVIGLVSAYVGLYGVARQVGEVFGAASREQTIRLRFDASFDGDALKVEQAMAFVRAESARLKLSFLGAGEEFSQFVASLPRGQHTIEQIQGVFTGFTTASVALGLSNEKIKLVFLALTQIASKGTVTMEELKRQLGDSLPGAMNLFAEAAGFSSDRMGEFIKLVESGGLSSDILFKVADALTERFGKQVPAALKKPAAVLRDFQRQVELVQLAIAKSGFLDQLTRSLQNLTQTLKDPATQAALINLADLIGTLLERAVALIPYMDELLTVFLAFQAVKFVAFTQMAAGATGLNQVLPKLLGNLKKLNFATGFFGGALGVELAIVGSKVTELIGVMLEVDRIQDRNKATIKKLGEEYNTLFSIIEDGVSNLKNKSLEELEELHKKALEAATKATEEQTRKIAANQLTPLKLILQQLVGAFHDLRPFDNEELEESGEKLKAAQGYLAKINEEIDRRPKPDSLGGAAASLSKEIANTKDDIEAYTAAILNLENANLDDIIRDINDAFTNATADFTEAEKATERYAQLMRQHVNKLVAVEEYRSKRIIQIAEQEAQAKLDLLAKSGLNESELQVQQRGIITELAKFRVTETTKAVDSIRDELDRAKTLERNYANEVIGLQKTIATERAAQAAEQFQQAIDSGNPFIAHPALEELRRQLAEYDKLISEAFDAGKFKDAEALARAQKALAESLSGIEIKNAKNGAVIVSQEQSKLEARKAILAADQKILEALRKQEEAARKAAKTTGGNIPDLEKKLKALEKTLENLRNEEISLNAKFNPEVLKAQLNEIKANAEKEPLLLAMELDDDGVKLDLAELQKPTQSIHTVKLVLSPDGDVKAILEIAGINISGFSHGGKVEGFAGGGGVRGPGTSTSDSILARLSNGEFVINAAAVRHWGADFFNSLNNFNMPFQPLPRFALGGPVALPSFTPSQSSVQRKEYVLNINGNRLGPFDDSDDVIDSLINSLNKALR